MTDLLTSETMSVRAGDRVLVYLVNGNEPSVDSVPVWRRVFTVKGVLCIRDHGIVPLRRGFNGVWLT